MTCHVLMKGSEGIVTLADSQASDSVSELHGMQKIYPGEGWIIGGAGSADILMEVFEAVTADQTTLTATTIEGYVLDFADSALTPSARAEIHLYVATDAELLLFKPGTFRRMQRRTSFLTIGSGAEFVHRAHARDADLGIDSPGETLADTFASVEASLDAANESLTVDDRLMLGLINGGRVYLAGDKEVSPRFAPGSVSSEWPMVADHFRTLRALAQALRGERREAQRNLSTISVGALTEREIDAIRASNTSIAVIRDQLSRALVAFMVWYDGLIGRARS